MLQKTNTKRRHTKCKEIESWNVKAVGTYTLPLCLNGSTAQGNKQGYEMFSTIAYFMI
jgi:hypothetical protein